MTNQTTTVETETEFRIALLNRSGNVTKTTLARHLLSPRMKEAGDIIYIEHINADAEAQRGKIVDASKFERISMKMMQSTSAIVDIGSSNFKETLDLMSQIEGSYEDFDYFLVPVVDMPKVEEDSINTIKDLINLGVDPEKIKVVFNIIPITDNVPDLFPKLLYAMKQMGVEYIEDAVVYKSAFFPSYERSQLTLDDLFTPSIEENKARQNDLRRMKNRTDEETKELFELSKRTTLQRNALSATSNLDAVYNALFSKEVTD